MTENPATPAGTRLTFCSWSRLRARKAPGVHVCGWPPTTAWQFAQKQDQVVDPVDVAAGLGFTARAGERAGEYVALLADDRVDVAGIDRWTPFRTCLRGGQPALGVA